MQEKLYDNFKWVITKISENEISISNGNDICYAFIDKKRKKLFVDRIIYPRYVERIALHLAMKKIKDIYND